MGGSSEWDNRMMDSLKNFDLSSPEVKQQFGKCLIEMPIRFVNLSVFFLAVSIYFGCFYVYYF